MYILRRVLALFILMAGALWAQSDASKGRIVGVVYDPAGAVVPGATVRAENAAVGLVRSIQSNEEGQYQFVSLPAGNYELSAQSEGFSTTTITGLVLNVGSNVPVDITLQVEASAVTIEVGTELLDTIQPTTSPVVNSQAILNLPINGRRFQDFALLTPTIQVDRSRGQLSFMGQRGINTNVMVDGSDYNQPFFGGIRGGERSNFVITTPQSAVQEFQVVTAGYSAEYGRSSGGVLNAITKGGTNDLHGDAFYLLRHKEMGAKTPFGQAPLETQHQFGGSVGGALREDRAFWFFAVERQDAAIARLVEFPRLAAANRDAGAEAYDFLQGQQGPFDSTNDATALTGRADLVLSKKHRLTLRYSYSDAKALNAASVGGPREQRTTNALSQNGNELDTLHFGTAQLTSVFSPAMINELRFTGSAEERPRTANSETPTVTSTIGAYGARSFLPTVQDDRRLQFQDTVSIVRGTHSVRIGIDFNDLTASQLFGFNQFGVFTLSGSDPSVHLDILSAGGTIAHRFDDTSVRYQRQIGNLFTALDITQLALFVQDTWRVTPEFTLNYGLRWEGQYNPTPEVTNTALLDRVRGVNFPIGSVDPGLIPDATDQIMPRLGIAWRPLSGSERTVVRANVGLFYASTPMLLFSDAMNNFRATPGNLSLSLPTTGSTVYKDFLNAGIDLNDFAVGEEPIIDVETVQRAAGGGAVDPFRGAAPITIANDYENPRSLQYSAGFDQELATGLVVGAQFNYVNTVHLQRNRDFNLPLPIVRPEDPTQIPFFGLRGAGATRPARLRPVTSLSQLTVRQSSARSMYRGVTLSGRYRAGRLQWTGYYTYAQAFSDDDNERNSTGFNYINSFNLRDEYAPSDLDVRHQLTSNAVVSLPFGFEVSGILRATSGFPLNPVAGSDLNEDFESLSDRGLLAPGVFLGRNSSRNRSVANVDFRVLKSFSFDETKRLQLSFEFFNLFNADHVVFDGNAKTYGRGVNPTSGAVEGPLATFMRLRLQDGSYDRVNSQVGSPFQMQVGLRFFF